MVWSVQGGLRFVRSRYENTTKPDAYLHYEQTIQEAYDALSKVEEVITSLGMKLECQHFLLGGALDELKPLLRDTRSAPDKIVEAFEQRLP